MLKIRSAIAYSLYIAISCFGNVSAQEVIHVFMGTDSNYVKPTLVAMASMLYNLRANKDINIHMFDFGLTNEDKISLESLSWFGKPYISDYLPFTEEDARGMTIAGRWPIGVFAKYWIPYYSQKYNIDQAIWLDGDVIVEGDIEKLWNVDLADNYLAGVPDVISAVLHAKVGSKFAGHTLNAGVLLFNCNKLLEFNFLEKLAQETNALQDNALFVEQEALARVAYNHQLLLPYRYNVQTFQDVGYSVLSSDLFSGIMHNWLGAGGLDLKRYLQPSCSDGLIYHYCGCLRPWTASGVLNPYTDRWYRYLKLTQYYDFSAVIKSDLLCGASTGVKRVTQTYRWIRAVLRS